MIITEIHTLLKWEKYVQPVQPTPTNTHTLPTKACTMPVFEKHTLFADLDEKKPHPFSTENADFGAH